MTAISIVIIVKKLHHSTISLSMKSQYDPASRSEIHCLQITSYTIQCTYHTAIINISSSAPLHFTVDKLYTQKGDLLELLLLLKWGQHPNTITA